jgi:hypothetical protein
MNQTKRLSMMSCCSRINQSLWIFGRLGADRAAQWRRQFARPGKYGLTRGNRP